MFNEKTFMEKELKEEQLEFDFVYEKNFIEWAEEHASIDVGWSMKPDDITIEEQSNSFWDNVIRRVKIGISSKWKF